MTENVGSFLLSGVRVVSFTHFLQGPSAVQFLADLGADVVKVEPLAGGWEREWSGAKSYLGGESVFFLLAHRNQRSLALNLKAEGAPEVARRLIAGADVLVENYRPGVMDRLGYGYEAVRRRNPGLVYCSCSGYGADGPYRELPGQDLLLQGLSGLANLTGPQGSLPTPVGTAVVDQHAGTLAALAVLACLVERNRTGSGRHIDVNLLDAALDLQIEPFSYYLNGAELADKSASGVATRFHRAPYGAYRTRDGAIILARGSVEQLIEATASEELRPWIEADPFDRREEISAALAKILAERSTAEWLPRLRAAGIWCAPANDYDDVVADPQVRCNHSVQEYAHPKAGRVRYLSHPARYDGERPPLRRRPPLLSEHTDEILEELGFTPEEKRQLCEAGAITAPAGQ